MSGRFEWFKAAAMLLVVAKIGGDHSAMQSYKRQIDCYQTKEKEQAKRQHDAIARLSSRI